MNIFEQMESNVQVYARSFPRVFNRAQGEFIYDENGRAYLDFLSGAGTLNYGHNNPVIKKCLLEYLERDGIAHGLDMHTVAKAEFLHVFGEKILRPRGLSYMVQFTGPTGTNAVEAALKIARNVTGRSNILAFTNGFHGVTLGALAATANAHHRDAAGVMLTGVTRAPYDGYLGSDIDSTLYIDKLLSDASSGVDLPAAVIVETVQGEGGVNVAGTEWLRRLHKLCKKHKALMIVDDIQAGCGRTGKFFSFEEAGIYPDIVTVSKSLSGFGLPMALVLLKPHLDQWKPGEHNGTFRGNNLAFVTAKAAIDHYWTNDRFAREITRKSDLLKDRLEDIAHKAGHGNFSVRGRGMFLGMDCVSGEIAQEISRQAFRRKLIVETCGADNQVIKLLCPLTIADDNMLLGLDILEECTILAAGQVNSVTRWPGRSNKKA